VLSPGGDPTASPRAILRVIMRPLVICGCLFLLIATQVRAQEACSHESLQNATARFKSTQQKLLAVKVGYEGMDTDVQPSTRKLIHEFKDALAATVAEYMSCTPKDVSDVKQIEVALTGLLGGNWPGSPTSSTPGTAGEFVDQIYGSHLSLSVARPSSHSELVIVKFIFGINCGDDNMLLVYERRSGRWSRVLFWQSGDYTTIGGAFGDFFSYLIVPRGGPDDWVLAVAHGMPWCTSRWSGFDVDVIQPAHGDAPQRLLFHREAGYVRDEDVEMKLRPGGFEIRAKTGSIDMEIMTRKVIYSYRLVDGTVQRVQPVALNGRDFVDEWLKTDWKEAEQWSAQQNAQSLREMHAQINELRSPGTKNWTSFTYRAVRACSVDPGHFQVELDQDPGVPTYFQIRQGNNYFEMLSDAREPDPKCNGPDLMRKPS